MKILLLTTLALGLSLGAFAQGQMAQLGVATRPADKAVTDVLGLPEGFGLIVEDVVAGSAADTSGIQQHDLLHKFDGQLLTSPRQLALLVRSKKPKDKVGIDYLRKGKAANVEVQLGATERTELAPENAFGFDIQPPKFEMFFDRKNMKDLEAEMAAARERLEQQMGNLGGQLDNAARDMEKQMQQLLNNGDLENALGQMEKELGNLFQDQGGLEKQLQEAFGQAFGQLGGQPGEGLQNFAFGGNASAKTSTVENGMKYTFSQENDKKTFQVEDLNGGKMLFDGPVNTEDERAKVPAGHVAKLKKMEKNTKIGRNGGALGGVFQFNVGPGGMMFGGNGLNGLPGRNGRNARNGADGQAGKAGASPKVQEGVISIIDDELTVSISERDGQQHCRAVDPDGKVLFDGPIVTQADQDKLPIEVREVLEDLNALPAPSAPAAPKKPAIEEDEEL